MNLFISFLVAYDKTNSHISFAMVLSEQQTVIPSLLNQSLFSNLVSVIPKIFNYNCFNSVTILFSACEERSRISNSYTLLKFLQAGKFLAARD